MELTLSPNFEREAIQEIRARSRAESARPLYVAIARFVARPPFGGLLRTVVRAVMAWLRNWAVRWVDSRNVKMANHIRWFRTATVDLRNKVKSTGVPAGKDLNTALEELIAKVNEGANTLLPLLDGLDVYAPFGAAVHRSVGLLIELKACALAMQRAGRLEEDVDPITLRIEAAHQQMTSTSARLLAGTTQHDPQLLALAQEAMARRARGAAVAVDTQAAPETV